MEQWIFFCSKTENGLRRVRDPWYHYVSPNASYTVKIIPNLVQRIDLFSCIRLTLPRTNIRQQTQRPCARYIAAFVCTKDRQAKPMVCPKWFLTKPALWIYDRFASASWIIALHFWIFGRASSVTLTTADVHAVHPKDFFDHCVHIGSAGAKGTDNLIGLVLKCSCILHASFHKGFVHGKVQFRHGRVGASNACGGTR